jgi:hypothetical protein
LLSKKSLKYGLVPNREENEEMENNRQQNEEVAVNETTLGESNESNSNEEIDIDLSGFEDDFELPDELNLADNEEDGGGIETDDEQFDENDETNDEAEQREQQEELEEAVFDSTNLVPSISKSINRIPEPGVVSIVNSKKNGKRVAIASDVHSRLNQPQCLQVGFIDGNLVLGEYLGDEYTSYTLKKQAAKYIIYSKELVEQITEHCELDFSKRTSITFPKATYLKMAGEVVAIISMS